MENAPARYYGKAFESESSLAALRTTAQMFSMSAFVKAQELKGGGQVAVNNAMILCSMAMDFGIPVYTLFNSVYFIHGIPAFSSQFFISQFNLSGKFSRIQYAIDGTGEERGCIASCTELATGAKLEGAKVTIRMAHESKWSAIWDKLPDQMLRYRAAVFLIRSIAPEVMLGLHSVDEERDIAASNAANVATPTVQPEQDGNILEKFEEICIFEGIMNGKEVVDFTVSKFAERGMTRTREEAMRTLIDNPSAIKRASKLLSSSQPSGSQPSVSTEEKTEPPTPEEKSPSEAQDLANLI